MARAKGMRGYRPFWPELEPAKPLRPYCYSCRSFSRPNHLSTAQHRKATRPAYYARGAGDHLKPRHFNYNRRPYDEGTPAQNRAAMRRLATMGV